MNSVTAHWQIDRQFKAGADVQTVGFDLLDSSNTSVYHTAATGTADRESIVERPISLYSSPNKPFPPEMYQLRAKTPDGRAAAAPIQLK